MSKNRTQKIINIPVNQTQMLLLMKLVYLGEWFVNASRDPKDQKKEYESIMGHILSFAHKLGLKKYVMYEKALNSYFPTNEFDFGTDVHDFIDEHEEESFWELLISKLARRDLENVYTKQEIKQMPREKYFELITNFEVVWWEEIEKHGVKRLKIEKPKKT